MVLVHLNNIVISDGEHALPKHTHTHTLPHHMSQPNLRNTLKIYSMMILNGAFHGKPAEYCHVAPLISKHIVITDGESAEYFHTVLNI